MLILPSANRNHLAVSGHEQLSSMNNVLVTIDSHPREFRAFGVQREKECLASTEIRLSMSAIVLQVSFHPS